MPILILIVFILSGNIVFMGCTEKEKEHEYIPQFPTNFEWVNISAGSFIMGAPSGEGYRYEHPQHKVTLTNDFQMLKCEVTQSQWEAITGENPSQIIRENRAVGGVTWNECQDYISELNTLDINHTYRLPTEAEWEYCCRAGTETRYFFGNNESELNEYAWYRYHLKSGGADVGELKANPWGLFDMLGNVEEWCQDRFDARIGYSSEAEVDPTGIETGNLRVLRGGSSGSLPEECTPYFRGCEYPDQTEGWIGFRLVRTEK